MFFMKLKTGNHKYAQPHRKDPATSVNIAGVRRRGWKHTVASLAHKLWGTGKQEEKGEKPGPTAHDINTFKTDILKI